MTTESPEQRLNAEEEAPVEMEVTEERIVALLKTRRLGHAMGTLEMAQLLTGNEKLAAPDKGVIELRARIQAVCDALLAMDRLERFFTNEQPFYRLPKN